MRHPPLSLDFAARRPLGSRGGWLLLAAGCVLTVAAALDWQDASDQTDRWQEKAAHWEESLHRAEHGRSAAGADAPLRPEADASSQALARLTIPWGALYRCLEDSADDTVSLLSVLPNPDKGELRLTGEAMDFPSLRSYLTRLGSSNVLGNVRLQREEVRESVAEKPVAFSLVAVWRTRP